MQTNANDNTKKLQSGHWREGLGGLPEDPQQGDPQDSRVREIIL